jgi:HSP20 family molecular chaperone IbpA
MSLDLALQEVLRKLETGGLDGAPASRLWEDETSFHVQLLVPGWMPHQMCLLLGNNMLTIQGERSFKTFLRVVTLPTFVNAEKARAVYDNDVLTISFPKRLEAQARRILIEVA